MKRIAVIGDAMVDYRRSGRASRVSPEDPNCQVLTDLSTEVELGGAANVAYWLAEQRDVQVTLFCHWALDRTGFDLKELCRQHRIELSDLCLRKRGHYWTTRKERFCLMSDERDRLQHLVRCDDDTNCVMSEIEFKLIRNELVNNPFDLVVVADYDKGMFLGDQGTRLAGLLGVGHGSRTIVNSKVPDRWKAFELQALICNEREAYQSWRALEFSSMVHVARSKRIIVTRGERGVVCNLLEEDNSTHQTIYNAPSLADHVIDVTGAGDAFTAGFAYMYLRRPQLAGHADSEVKLCINQGQRWAAHCCRQIGCGQPIILAAREGRNSEVKEGTDVVSVR